jgi:predicted RND superfamily exporter protein
MVSKMLRGTRLNAEALLIARVVAASCNRALIVVMSGVALGVLAVVYSAQHFSITTDTLDLISPDLAWRRNKAAFDKAFPQQSDLIVAVVDGATPELAERGAAAMTARLSSRADLFRLVSEASAPLNAHDGRKALKGRRRGMARTWRSSSAILDTIPGCLAVDAKVGGT